MVIEHREWRKALSVVNETRDLNVDTVISEIDYELRNGQQRGLGYLKWQEDNFNINYLFEVKNDEDVSFRDNKLTLLHLAVNFNLKNIVNALLGVKGINVNAVDNHKRTSLHHASLNEYQEIAETLLKNEANVNSTDEERFTPLHQASAVGCKEIVEVLLKNNANVNSTDKNGETPLHWAAGFCNNEEIVNVLVENGADPLLKNEYGQTPRDLATSNSIKKLLEEAEEKQKKLNEEKNKLPQDKDDNKDTTPLPEETEKNNLHQQLKKEFLLVVWL